MRIKVEMMKDRKSKVEERKGGVCVMEMEAGAGG